MGTSTRVNFDNARIPNIDSAGLALIQGIYRAVEDVDDHRFPALHVVQLHEDGEAPEDARNALLCPWCCGEAREEHLHAVSYAMQSCEVRRINIDGESVRIDTDGWDDVHELDGVAFFEHDDCDRPVSLPEGWDHEWN